MTEYLQEIKHKGKMESNCENKTECLQNRNADTVGPLTCPDGAQYMERCVQCVERLTTTRRYAEVAGTKEYTALTHKWNNTKMKTKLR